MGDAGHPQNRMLTVLSNGGHVETTCSGGRCPQPITIDREFANLGRCYAHAKVERGLIQDYYEGPTFDGDGHKVVDGELVPMVLP